ncbi:MAG: hypothetical protein WDZ29_00640 [Balneolaceae bacterium]
MNLGLSMSFIISGVLILMIATLNLRLGQHSSDLALHEMSKTHIEAVYEMLLFDFQKAGYDIDGAISSPIFLATPDTIAFEANVEADPVLAGNPPIVMWGYTDQMVPGSGNPDHRILQRIVSSNMVIDTPGGSIVTGATTDEVTNIGIGVTRFELQYYTAGSNTPMTFPIAASDMSEIRRIEIFVETQPREGVGMPGGEVRFPASQWRKTIVPPNLDL